MSEESIIRAKLLPDGSVVQVLPDGSTRPLASETDWQRVQAMSEEDIEAAALTDPENPPLSEEELAQLEPVPNVKAIRESLGMTQETFAKTFHLSSRTVEGWEQGRFVPDQAARTLLMLIACDPEAVKRVLRQQRSAPLPS
jgi:putative transcriptional regulator